MEGRIVGERYEMVELVGSGGMADVYRAYDTLLGRHVALKILHPQYAKDPIFVQRFRQEAQAAANLNHPNVVSVYDWGIEEDYYYLVMEFVEGHDLKDIINYGGPILPERVVEISCAICDALAAAHARSIVHRDIKPQNIIVTPTNRVKVMDFGIARAGDGGAMTQTGAVMGTPQYISPEQAQGRTADSRSDIYSLGVVMYEMLTGRVPFEGDNPVAIAYKHVQEDPLPPSMVNPDVTPELEAVVMKALAKNPENRYQSAQEMRNDLDRCLQGAPVSATPLLMGAGAGGAASTQVIPRQGRTERRRGTIIVWVVIIAVLLAAGGFAAWAFLRSGKTIEVPDLVGKTFDQAQGQAEELGLKLKKEKEVTSKEEPADSIISQDPEPGAKISEGGTISVVVSKGAGKVAVPDLTNLTESQAAETLEKAGLELGSVQEQPSLDVERGKVVGQSPEAGDRVEKGSSVNIVVSKGMEMVRVPDVVGLTQEDAREDLEEEGLSVSVTEEETTEYPEGTVISQSPEAGERVPEKSTISLVVATRPETSTVPNVVGTSRNEAVATLQDRGYRVRILEVSVSNPAQVGMVVEQDPSSGTELPVGERVTISIGKS